jgi:hypothetical protein
MMSFAPVVFHHMVNRWYWSLPGIVPDKEGMS